MLEQQHPHHDFGRGGWPTTGLAFLATLRQRLLHDLQQPVILQNTIAVRHPRLTQIINLLGNEAVGEATLQASSLDHWGCSRLFSDSR